MKSCIVLTMSNYGIFSIEVPKPESRSCEKSLDMTETG